jgi:hypothetical protein
VRAVEGVRLELDGIQAIPKLRLLGSLGILLDVFPQPHVK